MLPIGHTGAISSVCFSPNGKYVLSGTGHPTPLKLWDIATGKEIKSFKGHTRGVTTVCFLPDGKYALSGSRDNTHKLWDIALGKELVTLIAVDKNDWVVTTPDGRFDASEVGMKLLYYVKGLEIIPLDALYDKFYTPNWLAILRLLLPFSFN